MAKGGHEWQQEAAERFKEQSKGGRFKLVEGENTIRFLPRIGSKNSTTPFMEYQVHREVGPNKRFVRCGHTMRGDGECWLCDEKIPELANSKNPQKEKRAVLLEAQKMFCFQVATIDADSSKWQGPYFWAIAAGGGRALSTRILGVLKNTKREWIDPEEGYNLTIERTGTGKTDTIYGQLIADDEPSKLPDKILAAAKPFSTHIPAYSEEQQKAAYFGEDADAATEDEERGGGRAKKKPVAEEDEAAEPETETTEEEEPPAKPKKKPAPVVEDDEEAPRPKKKPAPVVEEEEEAVAEDEEAVVADEEEEPPAKPKKKPAPVVEDEEEERPRKKGKPVEEDENAEEVEEPAPKPKKKVYAEEEDEPPAKPKKKAARGSDDD
jgi:hypothetical protein